MKKITALLIVCCLGLLGGSFAQNAYITNASSNNVSVIDTATNTVTATIPVGTFPWGVAVSPDNSTVYVSNIQSTAIPGTVSVIDTATNTVIATISVGTYPNSVAVSPDGSKVYVANASSNNVSVIDTVTDTVIDAVNVGKIPQGIAVSPDGSKVYVANDASDTVSVIATATDTIMATIAVGHSPVAFGLFIQTASVYQAFVQPPINADGSSIFRANRGVVPVKFTLTKNDAPTCALPPATISVTRTAGGTLGAIDESSYSMAADSGSNFRIDPTACQYVYNLAASSLGVGTYRVDISINGVVVGHAVFALK